MSQMNVQDTILLKNTPEILSVLNKLWDPRGKILVQNTNKKAVWKMWIAVFAIYSPPI